MKKLLFIVGLAAAAFVLVQCNPKPKPLFNLLPSSKTGITFSNKIQITDSFNILTEEYIYNGGGVAIGDFNRDGQQDIFFTGNMVPNKLYLNQGGFKFKDISDESGISMPGRWNSGVAVADINLDGWPDIYVCATMKKDSSDRRNRLFINKGLNQSGIPVFEDQASAYHLDDTGYSTNAAFFDYDRDGDLDVYVLTDQLLNSAPTNYRPKIVDGSSPNNDRLYRNNGDNTFTNVTKEAGILFEGFGLGLSVADINKDGWPDLYVSNDYVSNDLLYINKNGSFQNQVAQWIGHTSHSSMGNDIADINNDGLPDIVTLDMLPETNLRKKTTIHNKSYTAYSNNEKYHYEYQYMRNMLQLNNGLNQGIKFSEIGMMAGVFQTEWSWSPLLADFDNDGFKDLVITNGFPMDVTDKDFAMYRSHSGQNATNRQLLDSIPVIRIPNYVFRNNGDLTFTDMSSAWGFRAPSFSNGAAYADLDNDGDLDYVVNNIDDEAFVYENTLYNKTAEAGTGRNNYLRIKLNYKDGNPIGLGTKITLYGGSKIQYGELYPSRGYLSSVEDFLHFGMGGTQSIDSLVVVWPDGKHQKLTMVHVNQVLSVSYRPDAARENNRMDEVKVVPWLVQRANRETAISFKHEEEDKFDFNIQRTLPHKFTQSGPGLAVGDVNGDGLEDFVVGGSTGHNETLYLQKKDGTFSQKQLKTKDGREIEKTEEDEGLLLFDADQDDDLDLFVVSGSIESTWAREVYQDRLYLNNGKGEFAMSKDSLPDLRASGSCVRAADFDRDGDLDLFVGGRVVLGGYPLAPESYLLRNDHGKFSNVTASVCPELKNAGMVTDAVWTDFNLDGKIDIMVVGEFMSITFFKNEGDHLTMLKSAGLEHQTGWWNSIAPGDFDGDGDVDYVVGNLGLNNYFQIAEKTPLVVFGKDFDNNGSVDPVLASYMRESPMDTIRKLYPVPFWDEISSQSPLFRRKFGSYKQFGSATAEQLFTEKELKDVLKLEANQMASAYVENLGNEKFALTPLPVMVQVAPVNGMVADDFNGDGNLDVMMVGNDYGNEVFVGRYDAFTGLILLGNGKGTFSVVSSAESEFYVPGDAKALAKISGVNGDLYVASQNQDSLKVFKKPGAENRFELRPGSLDTWVELVRSNGSKQRIELYYGSGYLSQSSRSIRVPSDVTKVILHDSKGQSREIVVKGK